jgi:sugar phosphate isomerase/epimerase
LRESSRPKSADFGYKLVEYAMKAAVTICLVPEARGGPFVFHGGLADGCSRAAKYGFDAVEIFAHTAGTVNVAELERLLAVHRLSVAAFGTGAGWLVQKLSLTAADEATRSAAQDFVAQFIRLAGHFGAPVIIGSMQGRYADNQRPGEALEWLREGLNELGEIAAERQVSLLIEPLNRYETNLLNRLGHTAAFVQLLKTTNVQVLADLFHMNIEEADMASAVRAAGRLIGHVHFADSNRQAIGFGHTDAGPVIGALREIGYTGYLSAEVLPLPTEDEAARQTIAAIRRFT